MPKPSSLIANSLFDISLQKWGPLDDLTQKKRKRMSTSVSGISKAKVDIRNGKKKETDVEICFTNS